MTCTGHNPHWDGGNIHLGHIHFFLPFFFSLEHCYFHCTTFVLISPTLGLTQLQPHIPPSTHTHTHTQVTDTSFSPVIYSPISLCNSCFSCPPSLHHEGESYFLPPLLTHLIQNIRLVLRKAQRTQISYEIRKLIQCIGRGILCGVISNSC